MPGQELGIFFTGTPESPAHPHFSQQVIMPFHTSFLFISAIYFFHHLCCCDCCWARFARSWLEVERVPMQAWGYTLGRRLTPLWLLQEVNSVEAIKTAVACNLGVAFVSKLAVEREVAAGQLHALTVKGIPLTRSLRCVANPARYQSRAVRAFIHLMFDPSTYLPADVPTPLEEEVLAKLFPTPPLPLSRRQSRQGSMACKVKA